MNVIYPVEDCVVIMSAKTTFIKSIVTDPKENTLDDKLINIPNDAAIENYWLKSVDTASLEQNKHNSSTQVSEKAYFTYKWWNQNITMLTYVTWR